MTAALERQIIKNPDDPAPYLVLGDQLLAAGDPHGELIAVQNARRERPKDKTLAKQEKAQIKKLSKQLFGDLAKVASAKVDKGERPTVEWFMGFVRSIRLSALPDLEVVAMLPHLATAPALRFVQEIRFGKPRNTITGSYDDVFDLLAATRLPKTVRSMFFGNYWDEGERYIELGTITKIYRMAPDLERLHLRGSYNCGLDLGKLELPKLRELVIESDFVDEAMLMGQITKGKARAIERLKINFGPERAGTFKAKGFRQLLDAVPKLRALSFEWLDRDDLVATLVESKLAGKLEHLTLPSCHLTDEDVELLVKNKKRFKSLASLDVDNNNITDDGLERLAGFCARVELGSQYEPDDY